MSLSLGIDLGGTNTKIALVDDSGRILAKTSFETRPARGPVAVVADMVGEIPELCKRASQSVGGILGVGVGSPGPLSVHRGVIIETANLTGWANVPLPGLLQDGLNLPAFLENDANAAALGESWVGAGRDCEDLVALTLGTGIGGGILSGGKLLRGHFENAAEIGHTIMEPEGLECPCGQRGCLERYASASGIVRLVCTEIRAGRESLLGETVRTGGAIDARDVVDAAQKGDGLSQEVFSRACDYLGQACVNIQHMLNPQRIILGGGMAGAGDLLLNGVRESASRSTWRSHADLPEIVLAELGNDAGVVGAALIVFENQRTG